MGSAEVISAAVRTVPVLGGAIAYSWIPRLGEVPGERPCCVVMGFFDGFHRGHRHLTQRAVECAHEHDAAVVAVTFDVHPRTALGRGEGAMLLQSSQQRYRRLLDAGADAVMAFSFTPELASLGPGEFVTALCAALDVRHVFVGSDFRFGAKRRGDVKRLASEGEHHGFAVTAVEPLKIGAGKVSSTRVRAAIAAGDMTEATSLLGRAPEIPIDVLAYNSAKQLAMFRISGDVAVPPDGLYLGRVRCVPNLPVVIDLKGESGVGQIWHLSQPPIDSMSVLYSSPVTLEFLDDATPSPAYDEPAYASA